MPKSLNQKFKRTTFLIWTTSILVFIFTAIYFIYPYINFYTFYNFIPYLQTNDHSASRFYGENIDMSQILPTSQHYIVNDKGKDLIDIAAYLGINLIRITNGQRSFNNNSDSVYTRNQWNQVLSKMQNKGIRALIVVEVASNNRDYYTPDIRKAYLHLVQNYIDSGVFSNPDVYAVDLKNEPLLTDGNVRMLQAAHEMIKEKYPNLKQTIGWWATAKPSQDFYNPNNYNWSDFSAGKKIANIVDFYSIHMYGFDANNFEINLDADMKTKVFLSNVENGLQTKKPILIEEFGEANGDAVSDQNTIGNPYLQAKVYQGVYQGLKEIHSNQLIGSVAFDFYSRNRYNDAWSIVKDHGNYLFPAAYVLQEYALGKNSSSSKSAIGAISASYLVKNASNNTIKNLHISDRIGLKLQLDNSKSYSIFVEGHGILRSIELFHYSSIDHYYYAVYQAVSKGSVRLNIIPTDDTYATPIFTLIIKVQ